MLFYGHVMRKKKDDILKVIMLNKIERVKGEKPRRKGKYRIADNTKIRKKRGKY